MLKTKVFRKACLKIYVKIIIFLLKVRITKCFKRFLEVRNSFLCFKLLIQLNFSIPGFFLYSVDLKDADLDFFSYFSTSQTSYYISTQPCPLKISVGPARFILNIIFLALSVRASGHLRSGHLALFGSLGCFLSRHFG